MGHAQYIYTQFSVNGWYCVPSLLFDMSPNYGGGNENNGKRFYALTVAFSAPDLAAGHCQPTPPLETPGH